MTINTELLEKVFERILTEPQKWDQSTWISARPIEEIPDKMLQYIEVGADAACGTTACMAGHAMLASGKYKQEIYDVTRDDDGHIYDFEVRLLDIENDQPTSGHEVHIGAELLSMDYDLAYLLFHTTESVRPQHFVAWAREVIRMWEAGEVGDPNEDGEYDVPSLWDSRFVEYEKADA